MTTLQIPDTDDLTTEHIALIEALLDQWAPDGETFTIGSLRATPCRCIEGPMVAWTHLGERHCVRCGHDERLTTVLAA